MGLSKCHIHELIWIASKGISGRQRAHTDRMHPSDVLTQTEFSFIMALEGGAKFTIWPDSHLIFAKGEDIANKKVISPVNISLQCGDILVFRIDVVHAGAETAESNIRVHGYYQSVCTDAAGSGGVRRSIRLTGVNKPPPSDTKFFVLKVDRYANLIYDHRCTQENSAYANELGF